MGVTGGLCAGVGSIFVYVLAWNEFVDEGGFNFFSMTPTVNPKRNPFRRIDSDSHVLAAHVSSDKEDAKVNAIFVSDIDMISDFFFEERNLGNLFRAHHAMTEARMSLLARPSKSRQGQLMPRPTSRARASFPS